MIEQNRQQIQKGMYIDDCDYFIPWGAGVNETMEELGKKMDIEEDFYIDQKETDHFYIIRSKMFKSNMNFRIQLDFRDSIFTGISLSRMWTKKDGYKSYFAIFKDTQSVLKEQYGRPKLSLETLFSYGTYEPRCRWKIGNIEIKHYFEVYHFGEADMIDIDIIPEKKWYQ